MEQLGITQQAPQGSRGQGELQPGVADVLIQASADLYNKR